MYFRLNITHTKRDQTLVGQKLGRIVGLVDRHALSLAFKNRDRSEERKTDTFTVDCQEYSRFLSLAV